MLFNKDYTETEAGRLVSDFLYILKKLYTRQKQVVCNLV